MPFLGTTGGGSVKQYGGQANLGYFIKNSLRTRSSASAYLNRTFGTPTDNKKFTWSGWVKRGTLGAYQQLQVGDDNTSDNFLSLRFSDTDTLQCFQCGGGSYNLQVSTSAVFRDPSAWYHIVFVYDSANATSTNRIQFYVNGVLQAVSYAVGPFAQNTASQLNVASRPNAIGRLLYASVQYFDGYLAEVNFVDGQALTPSSFGKTDAATGQWIPKKFAGTYGTNGFYLKFADASAATAAAIGKDSSPNGNNWTPNNISVTAGVTYDAMTDVPTLTSATAANYPVMNPLDTTGGSITNGNLTVTTTGSGINCRASFVIPTTGKWYFEATDVVTGGNNIVGIANRTLAISATQYSATGSIYKGMSDNAVFGFAFNFDALTYTIYKNNSVDSSGSITSGITYSIFISTSASGGASTAFNFGQRPFTYTPPSGFVALNTYNL